MPRSDIHSPLIIGVAYVTGKDQKPGLHVARWILAVGTQF